MASSVSQLPVPRTSNEITIAWLSKALNVPESDIEDLQISSDSFSGSGNLSNIVQVEFTSGESKGKYNFIVKLLPLSTDPQILEVIYSDKFDQKEIFFYKELLPELLLQEVQDLDKNICPFHYGEIQQADPTTSKLYGSVLILENLQFSNYSMPKFDSGLCKAHLDEVIEFVAKLNVASKLLLRKKRNIPFPEIYPMLNDWHLPCESGNVFEKFKTLAWFVSGLETIDEVLVWKSKSTQEMRTSFKQLIPIAERVLYVIFKEGQKFPTIIHDDLWPHNFLIPPSGSNLPVKIIDWQMVGFMDPTHDLSHFLLSSLPLNDLNEGSLTELVTKYYKNYETLCTKHNLETGRTLEEFLKYFFTYGISYGLIWFALSCDSIFANADYREKLYRILELLYELKAPEFIMSVV